MKQLVLMGLLMMSVLLLTVTPTQADFIQCENSCGGTENADVIIGSELGNDLAGLGGDDFISGNGGDDALEGQAGNDILFGGLGADYLIGGEGNDLLIPGPDDTPDDMQCVDGGPGNDTTTVFASEISGCLVVNDMGGNDLVNLISFGPYSSVSPFGQPGFTQGWVFVVDPIAGGEIYIYVEEGTDFGVETITGLLSPDVTIVNILPQECQVDS